MSADSLDQFRIVCDDAINQSLFKPESKLLFISYWIATVNIRVSQLFTETDIKSIVMIIFEYLNTSWCVSDSAQHISYFADSLKQFYCTFSCKTIQEKTIDKSLLNSIEMSIHSVISLYTFSKMLSYKLVAYGSMLHRTSLKSSDYDIAIVCQSFDIDNNNKWFKKDVLDNLQQYIQHYLYAVFSCRIKGTKYPCLEITHHSVQFSADISVDSGSICTRNGIIKQWLKQLTETYNYSIRQNISFIKHWSKQRDINSNWRKYLSSYAYLLMTILIHSLYKDKRCSDLEILIAFFWYFGYIFDPQQDMIIIQEYPMAKVVKKIKCAKVVCIVDPITNQNVCVACEWRNWLEIKAEMRMAYTVCVWWTQQAFNDNMHSQQSLIDLLSNQIEFKICELVNNDQITNILHNNIFSTNTNLLYNDFIAERENESVVLDLNDTKKKNNHQIRKTDVKLTRTIFFHPIDFFKHFLFCYFVGFFFSKDFNKDFN